MEPMKNTRIVGRLINRIASKLHDPTALKISRNHNSSVLRIISEKYQGNSEIENKRLFRVDSP